MTPATDLDGAVYEFHRYLSDQVAPLMVVDEVQVLLQSPAPRVAAEAERWVSEQRDARTDAGRADLLMHVVRKLAQMGEFDLVPRPMLGAYLNDFGQELVFLCPASERPRLVASLVAFGEMLTAPGALLAETPRGAMNAVASRRMAVYLDQLTDGAEGERREEVASAFMATAALEAQSRAELDESLAPLRGVGIDPASQNVLNSIARSLPGWGLIEGEGETLQAGGERLGAMRQIVTLGEDDEEVTKRFREMVHSAIEQFNARNPGRAESILSLATQMIENGKVKAAFADNLRGASAYLDPEALRWAAERPETFKALRSVLSFFTPLSPEGLIRVLREETEEAARRDAEALLGVHGGPARALAFDTLAREPLTAPSGLLISLLRALRRIPQTPAGPGANGAAAGVAASEADVLIRFAGRGADPAVAAQAIYCLGQSKEDRAERALLALLRNYEGLLARAAAGTSPSPEDVADLLARTCAALAQIETPRSLKALVDHGLRVEPELGDCASRLAEAAAVDFSAHPELLKRLLDALRGELPRAVLGLSLRRDLRRATGLARALSGTPHPDVVAVFEGLARRHAAEEIGTLAERALEDWKEKARTDGDATPATTLSGDLGFFGLPMLLQTLEQGAMTGALSLIDADGVPRAQIWLERGGMASASFRGLEGEAAVYEMLIRPFPGTFAFVSRTDVPEAGPLGTRRLTGLVFEGVRRHDEWKKAAALVGDDARLAPGGKAGPSDSDEDPHVVEAVWTAAIEGRSPSECEASLRYDSYRIRRLLAHWVETDALRAA